MDPKLLKFTNYLIIFMATICLFQTASDWILSELNMIKNAAFQTALLFIIGGMLMNLQFSSKNDSKQDTQS